MLKALRRKFIGLRCSQPKRRGELSADRRQTRFGVEGGKSLSLLSDSSNRGHRDRRRTVKFVP